MDSVDWLALERHGMALDSAGHPHVLLGQDKLYYAWQDGSADWHYEDLTRLASGDAALALTADGSACISTTDVTADHVRYLSRKPDSWQSEIADSTTLNPGGSSIALDKGGSPHISYTGYAGGRVVLRYAFRDEAGWHVESADTQGSSEWGDPWGRTSLELDTQGQPHIIYHKGGPGGWGCYLYYTYKDKAGWHRTMIPDAGGCESSMALDQQGYPHISFTTASDWYPHNLMYTYRDGAGWHSHVVEGPDAGGSSAGVGNSLALDSHDRPCIGYKGYAAQGAQRALKYACFDATRWRVEDVAQDSAMDRAITLLAFTTDGTAHIAFSYPNRTSATNYIQYASRDAGKWTVDTLYVTARVGRNSSLGIDRNGYPHISYADESNKSLKYAYQDDAGWHSQVIDPTAGVQRASLAIDASGRVHVGYARNGDCGAGCSGSLKDLSSDGTGWRQTTYPLAPAGFGVSVLHDDYGNLHAVYSEPRPGRGSPEIRPLRYGYGNSDGWHSELIQSVKAWGDYIPSVFALDRASFPHVVYVSVDAYGQQSSINYAYRDGHGWHFVPVASESFDAASLAIGGDGYARLVYTCCHSSLGRWLLKYVYQDASGWHSEPLDFVADYAGLTGLVLDEQGDPRLSYHAQNGDLRYAYRDLAGWHIAALALPRDSEQPFLALDAMGNPHISYFGYSAGTLNYTHYVSPWLAWASPVGSSLMLLPAGARVDVRFGDLQPPAKMEAIVSGPAQFADGSQSLALDIASANGRRTLNLKPRPEATLGAPFTLRVTVGDLQIQRRGAVAANTYLPLVLKR